MTKEIRIVPAAELRLDQPESGPPKVSGYFAVYNSPSEVLAETKDGKTRKFREVLRSGSFSKVLADKPDARLLLNHEGLPLARTTSGTLNLAEDERGVRFDAELDPTDPDVQRIIPKLRRGDVNQCSFAFSVNDSGARFRREGGIDFRDIHEVASLYDVSMVTYAAYPTTSVSLRSYDEFVAEQVEIEARQTPALPDYDIMRRRLLLLNF